MAIETHKNDSVDKKHAGPTKEASFTAKLNSTDAGRKPRHNSKEMRISGAGAGRASVLSSKARSFRKSKMSGSPKDLDMRNEAGRLHVAGPNLSDAALEVRDCLPFLSADSG